MNHRVFSSDCGWNHSTNLRFQRNKPGVQRRQSFSHVPCYLAHIVVFCQCSLVHAFEEFIIKLNKKFPIWLQERNWEETKCHTSVCSSSPWRYVSIFENASIASLLRWSSSGLDVVICVGIPSWSWVAVGVLELSFGEPEVYPKRIDNKSHFMSENENNTGISYPTMTPKRWVFLPS